MVNLCKSQFFLINSSLHIHVHVKYKLPSGPQKHVSRFWSPRASPQTRAAAFLISNCFGYETMSNCSQNCWIVWNSAVLCFKWHIHIGVWTFARFVRPLLATILCIWEIWSLRIHVSHISMLAKNKKACHRTDFEADRWPEIGDFFGVTENFSRSCICL